MTAPIPLPDRIDLARAADLQATITGQIGSPVVLDARAVSHLSTPALQVFLAAAQTWRSNGHGFQFEEPSKSFLDMIEVAGLTLDDVSSPATETPT